MQSTQVDRRQLLSRVKRIVVKVGSSTISENFAIDYKYLNSLVDDLAAVKKTGKEVILVTSGAIAVGIGHLGLRRRPETLPGLQAAAAIGQSRLMHAYETRFQRYNQLAAMLLLTQEDFNSRQRYIHISDTLRTLLQFGVIPIINENDTVAVEEIKVGDNDTLAAHVTNLADADILIILSDRDGFYTADPRKHPNAELIDIVSSITEEVKHAAGSAGTVDGTGGMITKLRAAEIVTGSGEMMVLANGSTPSVVNRILSGEKIGTLFLPQARMSGRKRWIAYSRPPQGLLFVDNGARDALVHGGKSLLPSGLCRVDGDFEYGDTVSCLDANEHEFARGLVNYNTQEISQIMGKRTGEIEKILGHHYYDEVIHRDNLVLMQKGKT
ncbi:glutamate 5-kinase [Candidatus Poribacteria bacterium]|nr:glutamate 5-kinase [Candidatus Poribacteria bacterium]